MNTYHFLEFNTFDSQTLPTPPTSREKYLYLKRNIGVYQFFSLLSFIGVNISLFNLLQQTPFIWPLYAYFFLTIVYFINAFITDLFSKNFYFPEHKRIITKWAPYLFDRVDIFLPTAGEPIAVLENTWKGVQAMCSNYQGKTQVYCLDDANRQEVRNLATVFNFQYVVRPKPGWFKKAGNLRYGYKISKGEFIAIFDADFVPRSDFLNELLPYFHEHKNLGLVQTPQYFDVLSKQNWLERGAGAIQEFFYRVSQVSREAYDSSICVGSNAIYRRAALSSTGGTALVQHSEDVHTGFNMRMNGWKVTYVPIILAKGLCPANLDSFFKQQYRWCLGSMSLVTSRKFWKTRMSVLARMSYLSGFLYYLHTALSSLLIPIIPLLLLIFLPNVIRLDNYFLLLPSFLFMFVIVPFWHKANYGFETWSIKMIYGWAHLFAIIDSVTLNTLSWQPTGSKSTSNGKYILFRILQILCNLVPALIWVALALLHIVQHKNIDSIPLLISGLLFYLVSIKISLFYYDNSFFTKNSIARVFRSFLSFSTAMTPICFCMVGVLIIGRNYTGVVQPKHIPPTIAIVTKERVIPQAEVLSDSTIHNKKYPNKEAIKKSILLPSWQYYKKNFVSKTGQSIDKQRAYETTSEGQAYVLLRAVILKDRKTFDTAWNWTRENLQQREKDSLFSWLYGKKEGREQIIETENATDADCDIALSLLLASQVWDTPEYAAQAEQIITDIWTENVVSVQDSYYLVAGSQFITPKGYIINPSYLSPASFKLFALIDPKHPWDKLADDSYTLLQHIHTSTHSIGLFPNWILLTKEGEIQDPKDYISENGFVYGFDAFRVYFRLALDIVWFDDIRAKHIISLAGNFFEQQWQASETIYTLYSLQGEIQQAKESISTSSGPLFTFTFTNSEMSTQLFKQKFSRVYNSKKGYWGDGEYYDQNWAWFATAIYSGNIDILP